MNEILVTIKDPAFWAIISGAGGVLMVVVTAICWLLNKWEWLKIWNVMFPLGNKFDIVLQLKLQWLEKLIENVGILGGVPALISFLAGMVRNNENLKIKLKDILIQMAEKICPTKPVV